MTTTERTISAERENWIRLQTLTRLRWIAIAGQIAAVIAGATFFNLDLLIGPIAMTVGVLLAANIVLSTIDPGNRRLNEREAFLLLAFDILQLGVLLFLTGGLNNPFALLLLAPVTIASTVLNLRSMIILAAVAMAIATLNLGLFVPLQLTTGEELTLPGLFRFGFWLSLVIGVSFISLYARQIVIETHAMSDALVATRLALSREQKLTDLGGVVAAAAHELGTPLATIKLASSELIEELRDSDLVDDARLIRDSATRCAGILQNMGRTGRDDQHMRRVPAEVVVQEASEPHSNRGKTVEILVGTQDTPRQDQPTIERMPEIVHGLRNLIQNAVDFADDHVEIAVLWTADTLRVVIEDDGPGFPSHIMGRIGDPMMTSRRWSQAAPARQNYDGLGLGLFIAKTLLERTGATLLFANADPEGGAIVEVSWPRSAIEKSPGEELGPDPHHT